MTLDFTQTLAFAGVVLFVGYGLKRLVPPFTRYNLPAPVIGGLLVAGAITATRTTQWSPITFDTALQTPLMIGFFTTVGFAASVSVLRVGGPQVLKFFAISTVIAVVQNVVGDHCVVRVAVIAPATRSPPITGAGRL